MRYTSLVICTLFLLSACGGSDDGGTATPTPVTITVSDFSATIDENPTAGQSLGSVVASASEGTINFELISQSPAGAMSINRNSGELSVADVGAFDFETNPVITATVQISSGSTSETATVTINLNDLVEVVFNIWDGPTVTFTKANNADHTLEANQDRLTDNVWITRALNQGIFNIAQEDAYVKLASPTDTEWAIGTTEQIAELTFTNWEDMHGGAPPSVVDTDLVVHLITDDVYLDIKFTSWTQSNQGGGFTYERASNP